MSRTRWERATEIPLLVAGLVFLFAYSWQVLAETSSTVFVAMEWATILVWFFFGVDYLVRLTLSRGRWRWFWRNFADFIVLVLPPLRPLRLLRLVLLLRVFHRHAPVIVRNRILSYASLTTVLLTYIAALAVLEAERPYGSITTFGDSLWWSLVTITTVGYGDYTPVTFVGRAIAVGLMFGGIVLVGIIVGTLSSWIVESVTDGTEESLDETTAAVIELRDEVRQLRSALEDQGINTSRRP